MLLPALTILLGAFLLFEVQPIQAALLLPWFGGGAAVWTTCLLFFQVVLLLGYLYAHASARFLGPRAGAAVHLGLLGLSLLALPALPNPAWKPAGGEDPTLRLLAALAATIGLPYFLLAGTSPLVQAWLARAGRSDPRPGSPYRLYALSNAGSFLALFSYPVLWEPLLRKHTQALTWSFAYAAFALLCAATTLRLASRESPAKQEAPSDAPEGPGIGARLLWVALAGCACVLLLSVSAHLTQNIAAVPLLWVVPLGLYLLSFILCFERDRWYQRTVFVPLLALFFELMAASLYFEFDNPNIKALVPLFCAGLFTGCMVCHGELARLRPHPRHLTAFYLHVSLGGALGGAFAAVLAPHLFRNAYELPVGMVACPLLAAVAVFGERHRRPVWLLPAALGVTLAAFLGAHLWGSSRGLRVLARNVYGVLRVRDEGEPGTPESARVLLNGTIRHGSQLLDPRLRRVPTTYYSAASGVGLAVREANDRPGARVGVIGLGAGTLAAYGRPGDLYRFYEINPLVARLARAEFSFLGDCPARVEIVLGDARLSLEREPPQHYDVLVVDAFSGDAIPIHLLTREAFALYFRHLRPDGVLAVHVSNRFLALGPVALRAAEVLGKEARQVTSGDNPQTSARSSNWVLVTARRSFFDAPLLRDAAHPVADRPGAVLWTDDYSNLLRVMN